MNRPQLTVMFSLRDLYIGARWHWSPREDPADDYDYGEFRLTVCIVPMPADQRRVDVGRRELWRWDVNKPDETWQERVDHDTEWIWMLNFKLDQCLSLLRSGEVYGYIPAMQRWLADLRWEMERRHLDLVPDALRFQMRIREAIYTALENHRVYFYSTQPATAAYPALWQRVLIIELQMPWEEYARWAERSREYLMLQQQENAV